jgi:hypothetical protein
MDELRGVAGVTAEMLAALGEAGIKGVEDLACCATDNLTGCLDGLEVSREDCETLIMQRTPPGRLDLGKGVRRLRGAQHRPAHQGCRRAAGSECVIPGQRSSQRQERVEIPNEDLEDVDADSNGAEIAPWAPQPPRINGSHAVSIFEHRRGCRWIVTAPGTPIEDMRYCGAPVVEASSWCEQPGFLSRRRASLAGDAIGAVGLVDAARSQGARKRQSGQLRQRDRAGGKRFRFRPKRKATAVSECARCGGDRLTGISLCFASGRAVAPECVQFPWHSQRDFLGTLTLSK